MKKQAIKAICAGLSLLAVGAGCFLAGRATGRKERFDNLIAWNGDGWEAVWTEDDREAFTLDTRADYDGTIYLDDGENWYCIPLYIW